MIKNRFSTILGYKRLKIAAVARMTGLTPRGLFDIYHDKTKSISFDTLNKLCKALECTPNDLFRYIPDEETIK